MSFRPRFWPTVTTAVMLIALIGLGTWQVQRYGWKTGLIAKLQARVQAPAVPLPDASAKPEDIEFLHVRVSGTFLYDHEFFLLGRSLHGNPGLHVLTPLHRADGKGYVLIDRGWIPFDRRDPSTRAEGQVKGVVSFDGIIRLAKGPGLFTPDNNPARNEWYFVDPAAMARTAGIDRMPDYYVLSGATDTPGTYPVARQWRIDIRNDHAQYAVTWYLMAIALIVIYILYHRKNSE